MSSSMDPRDQSLQDLRDALNLRLGDSLLDAVHKTVAENELLHKRHVTMLLAADEMSKTNHRLTIENGQLRLRNAELAREVTPQAFMPSSLEALTSIEARRQADLDWFHKREDGLNRELTHLRKQLEERQAQLEKSTREILDLRDDLTAALAKTVRQDEHGLLYMPPHHLAAHGFYVDAYEVTTLHVADGRKITRPDGSTFYPPEGTVIHLTTGPAMQTSQAMDEVARRVRAARTS